MSIMDRAAFTGSNLGLERGSVRLAPSDATWAATFDNLARELQAALAGLAVAVEHVGSTAVPGLPAKPFWMSRSESASVWIATR